MRTTLPTFLFLIFSLSLYSQFPAGVFLEEVADGIEAPTVIKHAGDERIFICEKAGIIKILGADGQILEEPFLDLSEKISSQHERGLLGLAFHPDYNSNGLFYVSYTDLDFKQNIVEFSIFANNPNLADASTQKLILQVDQSFNYHLGGCLQFGPDGFLYISVGEAFMFFVSQQTDSFLGKILRIDVDNGDPYSIPAGNLFTGPNDKKEIWALGFRNPWKFSFDTITGDTWIADVGWKEFEEINLIKSDDESNKNFGFPCYEGFVSSGDCSSVDSTLLSFPTGGYGHDLWLNCSASVTGGHVYRNNEYLGDLAPYIYGDYCTGKIYATYLVNEEYITEEIYHNNAVIDNISCFGTDYEGELLVADIAEGKIFKISFDCPIPEFQFTVASCLGSADGGIEINIPVNAGITNYELKDSLGNIVEESEYTQLAVGDYTFELNNLNQECSKIIPIQIEQFKPYITTEHSSCSALNDGSVTIDIHQNVSSELEYWVETREGELIDPTEYETMYEGRYYLLVSDQSQSCVDSINFSISYRYDFSFNVNFNNDTLFADNIYDSYYWLYSEELVTLYNYDTIPNATEFYHVPTTNGYYYAFGIDSMGCKHRDRYTVTELTAINEVSIYDHVVIFPNPVANKLTIDLSNVPEQEQLSLRVFDLQGGLIDQKFEKQNSASYTLSTEQFPSGTYLLEISNGVEKAYRKFVKL